MTDVGFLALWHLVEGLDGIRFLRESGVHLALGHPNV
jgi:hypothetical protein